MGMFDQLVRRGLRSAIPLVSVALIGCSESQGAIASTAHAGASGMAGATSASGGASGIGGLAERAGATSIGGSSGAGRASNGGASAAGTAAIAGGGTGGALTAASVKPRVAVLTDIGNEPDDQESLVRFLVYSNELDVEALIATTSIYLKSGPREDLIRRELDAYEMVRPNLSKHASGFPEAEALRAATKSGQADYGMGAIGIGKSTAGSDHLISVVDRGDERPVWITIWGGSNTLAQSLTDVRATRTGAELAAFVAKMRVYAISDQDDTGAWLRREFPDLFYVVSPSDQGPGDYPRATWTGISGDHLFMNGPGYHFDLVDNPWLEANVIQNHGPLGALYPRWMYIMEGDTPSWLGLINNGLGWAISPAYGGWGGRYIFTKLPDEPHAIWTNDGAASSDSFEYAPGQTATTDQATIWRWRDHYQADFAARMDWCIADTLNDANHNPQPVLNGDASRSVVTIAAKSGTTVSLSAEGTMDPDGNGTLLTWWIYREAGTLAPGASLGTSTGTMTDVILPHVSAPGTLHVILQVQDDGSPRLFSYRRVILEVTP
jgi:hypothetical protein